LKTTLRHTLAMYSEVADEEARIERGMNCWEMPGMWREIRNLIVHHDSVAHTAFIKSNERTWRVGRQPVQSKTPNTDVLVAGAKLPLEARDVIHCFTHCNKTARVLQAQLDAWLVAPA
jgi:hypothetical protein